MNLDYLRKSAQARKELERLTSEELAALNLSFTQLFFDPFRMARHYFLIPLSVNGREVDCLLVRFFGAFCVLVFDTDDPFVLLLRVELKEVRDILTAPEDHNYIC